jgi:competence protein ComEC
MWSSRPFVRIFLFFAFGVIITRFIPGLQTIPLILQFTAAILTTIIALISTYTVTSHKRRQISGIIYGLLIIITGILITSLKTNTRINNNHYSQKSEYIANIIESPVETSKSIKALALIKNINNDSSPNKIPVKAICYFEKNNSSYSLRYGDDIIFSGKLSVPQGPSNPGEFDYGKYLEENGINFSIYLRSNTWRLIGYNPSNILLAYAEMIRKHLLQALSNNGLSGDNYAVAAAVLLGYDNDMESNLKQDYIMAGAMHILCVSGLHVGIIYLVLNFLLGFLRNTKSNNILKTILLLFLVWLYAAITGLSPSVQRATLMISIFIIGNLFKRNRDTYNTLAVSATILLILNPFLLFNVGFQLSYAAVLGIITFHVPIYKLLYFKNSIIDKIWSITVLSIAAQLSTFPIATYYFHFFPPWFWLTNLFTFPLSFLIIACGFGFVILSWIPKLSMIIGWLLSKLIYLLNQSVGIVKYLPLAGIDDIHTSLTMLIFLYVAIIFSFILFTKKTGKLILPLLICLGIIISLMTNRNYQLKNQKRLIVYNIGNHYVYEFINGKSQIIIADSAIINNPSKTDYHIKNSRSMWGINSKKMIFPKKDTILNNLISVSSNLITFDTITILINQFDTKYYPQSKKLEIDIMIASGKSTSDLLQLKKAFNIKKIIIDSSVPPWERRKILKTCTELGINSHDVRTMGAFMLTIN